MIYHEGIYSNPAKVGLVLIEQRADNLFHVLALIDGCEVRVGEFYKENEARAYRDKIVNAVNSYNEHILSRQGKA